jgi:Protein of unknown function (DUF2589)
MANDSTTFLAAEFQSLPLEYVISAPLKGAIEAQAIAASTTRAFIQSMLNTNSDGTQSPITVDFKLSKSTSGAAGDSNTTMVVKAPLLSMVPVPHLRIDSITSSFKYEINEIHRTEKAVDLSAGLAAGTVGALSKFVNISLSGSVGSKSKEESSMNRSGSIEITVHASESPIPEGLARMLNLLSRSIPEPAQSGSND